MQINAKRFTLTLLATIAFAASAQTPPPAPAQAPIATLQASTQLVIVDVVVEDKDGHPVHGLKPENFKLSEGHIPQTIRNFEEHKPLPPTAHGPELAKLPPGTFTNYTPVPPNGALNILLLDALNTPMKDQSYVRYQLQQYVKKADPGTRIAIFGLTSRLVLLQGFTSNPETLKDVVDHKLIPRASTLLDDPVSGEPVDQMSDSIDASAPGMAQLAANLTQFEAEMAATQTQFRVQYTLDALNTLAHYLAAFPGRKNLIWFSGSFPLNILPDGTLLDPFAVSHLNEEEFRETTTLLTKAQAAVYPIDARGLMTNPAFAASRSGGNTARSPAALAASINNFGTSQAAEHATMAEMADQTGGRAFYNTNDLASAVSQAIEAGSSYYTLAYTPTDRRQNGSYRNIHVELIGETGIRSPQLSYRHGYFAESSRHPSNDPAAPNTTTAAASNSDEHARAAYAHAAMSRGAPTPEDILFKVRVLPSSTTTEDILAPGNDTDPNAPPLKGPFRRLDVDYLALPSDFHLALQPDGKHTGTIEFVIDVYDVDGRLLNTDGRNFALNLPPDTYKRFLQGAIECHMQVSVPVKTETYLRIGIRDLATNRFGVVEIPSSSVAHLAPAAAPKLIPSAPSTTPSTSSPTSPIPSTPSAAPGSTPPSPRR